MRRLCCSCPRSNQQQRLAPKLLRGLAPAKRRRQRRGRRRLGTLAAAAAADARRAPSPHFLHDQACRRTVPDALGLLLRVETPQQELAVVRVVRETPTETDAKHDAAQHRARHAPTPMARSVTVAAAAHGHASETLDRLAHAVADLGAAGVLARYDGVQVDARRRAEDVRGQAPFRGQVV